MGGYRRTKEFPECDETSPIGAVRVQAVLFIELPYFCEGVSGCSFDVQGELVPELMAFDLGVRIVLIGWLTGLNYQQIHHHGDGILILRVTIANPMIAHLVHDAHLVIIANGPREVIVGHVLFALEGSPDLCKGVGATEFELPIVRGPFDLVRVLPLQERRQQELPQLDPSTWKKGS